MELSSEFNILGMFGSIYIGLYSTKLTTPRTRGDFLNQDGTILDINAVGNWWGDAFPDGTTSDERLVMIKANCDQNHSYCKSF